MTIENNTEQTTTTVGQLLTQARERMANKMLLQNDYALKSVR